MDQNERVAIDVYVNEAGALASMAHEVKDGLLGSPKSLPSKYFYDERGSWLFERITELPEYYLTRAEQALLELRSRGIAEQTRPEDLVELGPGSAKKTRTLIEAAHRTGELRRYVPVEVSLEMAEQTARGVAKGFPGLEVHAVVGDFEAHLPKIPSGGRKLVAFLGSTIGNFVHDDAVTLLGEVADLLEVDDRLLLGTDLIKDRRVLEAAYNDSEGVTAKFNRNILNVLNNQLDANFEGESFEHVSFFNEREERIETYLRSSVDQLVHVAALGLTVEFARDEMMRTEVSCKYSRESVERMLDSAGLQLTDWIPDDDGSFALSLAEPI